jgi:hypothetical protein
VAKSRVSCAPKLDFPSDPKQIFERLESKKIDGFVSDLDVQLTVGIAGSGLPRFIGLLLVGADITFVHQLLHQAVQHLVHLFRRHTLKRFLDALGLARIEHLALLERPLNSVLQIFECVLVPLAEAHVLVLKAALEKKVRERLQQVFGAEPEVVTGVFGVTDPLHVRKTLLGRE